ncbi:MAG: hypothetical protein K2H64_01865 [Desulfovibrio sp.]|nr:hypothetical protein [Desulfovibrio sp.]
MRFNEDGTIKEGEIFGELEPEGCLAELPEYDERSAKQDEKPVQVTVDDYAKAFGVPAWKQAALLRYMGWLPDRVATEEEYKNALEALDGRRLGGGRR